MPTAMAVVPTGTGHVTIRALEGSNTSLIDVGNPITPPVTHDLASANTRSEFFDGKSRRVIFSITQTIEVCTTARAEAQAAAA